MSDNKQSEAHLPAAQRLSSPPAPQIASPRKEAFATPTSSRLVFGGRIDHHKLERERDNIRAKLPTLRFLKFEGTSFFTKNDAVSEFFSILSGKQLIRANGEDTSIEDENPAVSSVVASNEQASPQSFSQSSSSKSEGCRLSEVLIYNLSNLSDPQFIEFFNGLQVRQWLLSYS